MDDLDWKSLSQSLAELEASDSVVRQAAESYDRWVDTFLWRSSMREEIEQARAAARKRIADVSYDPTRSPREQIAEMQARMDLHAMDMLIILMVADGVTDIETLMAEELVKQPHEVQLWWSDTCECESGAHGIRI